MRKLIPTLMTTFLASTSSHSSTVFYTDTVDVRNNSPIVMLFTLPKANYSVFRKTGSHEVKSRVELSNYYSRNKKQDTPFNIDGETWILRNSYSYQLNQEYKLHFHTSLIQHTGGISDRLIYEYHEALSLPQNGRLDTEHDRLIWNLNYQGNNLLFLNENTSAWGDSEISLTWKASSHKGVQLSTTLKLPTGNYSKKTGSEQADITISINQQNPDWLGERTILGDTPLSLWYGVGLGYLGKISALSAIPRYPIVMSALGGIAWQTSKNWILKTQVDIHSPLFKTSIRELGWVPVQISFESLFQMRQDIAFSAMIAQDIRPRSVPDVIFSTGLSFAF